MDHSRVRAVAGQGYVVAYYATSIIVIIGVGRPRGQDDSEEAVVGSPKLQNGSWAVLFSRVVIFSQSRLEK